MKVNQHSRLFGPGGCLTPHALRGYLDGSLRLSAKVEAEEHIRHCRICSEALEGYRNHAGNKYIESDLQLLTNRIRRVYSPNTVTKRIPLLIVLAIVSFVLVLMAILYIINLLAT
jgi:hypothetical protein